MSTEFEPNLKACEALSDMPTVHEAYLAFADNPVQEQATTLASVIIKAYIDSVVSRERYISQMLEARWIVYRDMELLAALKYHQEQTRPIQQTIDAIAKCEATK